MRRIKGVLALGACILLTGCGQTTLESDISAGADTGSEQITASEEIRIPAGTPGYRKIEEKLPKPGEAVENPGTREHFSFTSGDRTYVFTETEDLWLYNQAKVYDLQTQFMLNVKGHKVGILIPETAPALDSLVTAYSDDSVTIYRQQDGEIAENEQMYLKVYDLVYQIENWAELVNKNVIGMDALCQALAQMGTAIVPADKGETLTDVMTGLRMNPVMDHYTLAYREGVNQSGFLCCSPSTGDADHDNVSIYMSVQVPNWNTYAVLHFEAVPDYRERLEDTGEAYDGHPIYVDYTGELKYFLIGEGGRCVYLDGVPESNEKNVRSYTAKEAAYVFDLVLLGE